MAGYGLPEWVRAGRGVRRWGKYIRKILYKQVLIFRGAKKSSAPRFSAGLVAVWANTGHRQVAGVQAFLAGVFLKTR